MLQAVGLAKLLRLMLGVVVATAFVKPASAMDAGSIVGNIEYQQFRSDVFNNTRTLRILLPPSYHQNETEAYPVLIMNDGQDLFDAEAAVYSNAEWQIDETLAGLWQRGELQEFIVVGVDNAGRAGRANEYLPWYDEYLSPPLPDPQGRLYPQFIVSEVLPYIRARYRIRTEAKNTAIGGASYGALAALYTAIKEPQVFGKLLIESPSIYVDGEAVLNDLDQNVPKSWSRLYMAAGTHEHIGASEADCDSPPNDELPNQLEKVESLVMAGRTASHAPEIMRMVENCATHHSDSYARRFAVAAKFLFPPVP